MFTHSIDLFILKNMGAAIIDFRVCPPLVKCQNLMFSGFIDTLIISPFTNHFTAGVIIEFQAEITVYCDTCTRETIH
jgi:hypothetical protein